MATLKISLFYGFSLVYLGVYFLQLFIEAVYTQEKHTYVYS